MRVREAVGTVLFAVLAVLVGQSPLLGRQGPLPAMPPLPQLIPSPPDSLLDPAVADSIFDLAEDSLTGPLPAGGVSAPILSDSLPRADIVPLLAESLAAGAGVSVDSFPPASADSGSVEAGPGGAAPSADTLAVPSAGESAVPSADTPAAPSAGESVVPSANTPAAPSAGGQSATPDTLRAQEGSEEQPRGRGLLPLMIEPEQIDPYGIVAAWEEQTGDTVTVQPLEWWWSEDPAADPLFYRLHRRAFSRAFVRENLMLRPEFFASSDSIVLESDARNDSLVQEGFAPGLLYWSARSGGMRYLPPPGRSLARGALLNWQHDVDAERATIRRSRLRQGLEVGVVTPEPFGRHFVRLTRLRARSAWKAQIQESMKKMTAKGGRAGLVRISLPFELPPMVRSVFGEGKPNLSVSGSERISFGGRSQWFPHRPTYEFQRKPSKFPQLEMKQDLTIRLKGSIGDKLDVDVDQSSAAQTSLANRIGIHYHGYEDEIVRKIDLGNTSLRLPGTEYVSYGGSHTGLFGINAEAQVGDLTFNTIVSKEEGETAEKSTSVRSQEQSKTINDYEYVKDRFFFLADPTADAYPGSGGPFDIVSIREGSVFLYLDDGDGDQQESFATSPGYAVLDLHGVIPQSGQPVSSICYFQQLTYGSDFTVLNDPNRNSHPILILNRYLDQNATLGVVYFDEGLQRDVGGVANDTLYVKMIRPRYDLVTADAEAGTWGPTNRLMLKNVYPLHQSLEDWTGSGLPENSILQDGFELRIHHKGSIGGVEDPDEIEGTRLIRLLGIDYYQESNTGLVLGQDNQVDNVWVDFQNGYLFLPDLQPFSPGDAEGNLDLRGRPGNPNDWQALPFAKWNPGIYRRRSCVRDHDLPGSDTTWASRYYLEVRYRTPVSELRIDAWDIIEGSEVVTVGSRRLTRDQDYRIDYQTGVIRLYEQAQIGEDDEIRVTCKHAGGLGSISKTLLGAAMIYRPEESNFSMSTSWLYERTGSPDRRPRLGSEPTRIAVGEVAARYGRESMGLTRLLDHLPFLDARKVSQVSVEGGLGVSFPNPNTRNDLYIDDFEGVADDVYLRLNRLAWQPTSVPQEGVVGFDEGERAARRGEIWWYTPYHSVQEGDLNPSLEYQEANDYRGVLELQLWPYDGALDSAGTLCPAEESWMGIVQGLSRTNLDLTRARFLDIWVNDFVPWEEFVQDTSLRAGTMFIDIGQMNEDAIWEQRAVDCASRRVQGGVLGAANRRLDTEDANRDGELDLSTATDEDTGLDNLLGLDPNDGHDDYVWTADSEMRYETYEELCEVYRGVNGTEHNGRLDSEDLDGDNSLDQENSYFEFRVDLADSSQFLETDVRRDYADKDVNWTLESNNGWRRIRVPLSDAYVHTRVGDPRWDEAKHLRIWFRGVQGWKRLQIGAAELRSNRWIAEAVRDTSGTLVPPGDMALNEEDFFPGVYNNKENGDVYVPPFVPNRDEQRSDDRVREREQSLTLELRNFQPGHVGRVYQPFLRDQDYTGYESLELWLNSTLPMDGEAEFFLRLCKDANADTTDFYEYRVAVPVPASLDRQTGSWLPIKILLTDLSGLKAIESGGEADVTRELPDGGVIRMKGHPYLTRIRRLTLGVSYHGPAPVDQGNVWLDELRLTSVHKEMDTAMRMQVRTELSDFMRLDFSYRQVGSDFVSISGGGFNKRREQEKSYAISTGNMPLERLLPSGLGLTLPFSFQQDWSRRVPKYRTNDDLLVEENPTDRDLTEQMNRSYSLSIGRRPGRGGFLRYTLDALRLNGSVRDVFSKNPQVQDSTTTRTLTASYSFPFGPWGDIGIYKAWKLRPIPTSFSLSLTRSEREQARYRRESGDLSRPFVVDDRRTVRSGSLNLATGLKPLSAVNFDFKQSRDLMLREESDLLGGINIGKETSRQENLSGNYQLRLFPRWFEPRLSWNSDFRGSFNRQGGAGGGGLERYHELTNSRTRGMSLDLPLQALFEKLGSAGGGPSAPSGEEGEGKGEPEVTGDGQAPPRPQQPPSRRPSREDPIRKWFSVGRSTASFSRSDRSSFNRVLGEPSFAYQLGFSMKPEVEPIDNFRESLVNSEQLKFDADFQLLGDIAVTARFSDDKAETRSTGNLTGTRDRLLPELNVRWGDLPRKFGLKDYFRNFKANTRYLHKEKKTTRAGELARLETDSQWAPLFDVEVSFRSGFSATLRLDHSTRHSEDLTALKRISDRTDTRVDFMAKKSLSIVREVTIPIKNTRERITTKLDLSFTINFDTYRDLTRQVGYAPQVTADVRKVEVGLGGNYQFTRSVGGTIVINYGENADNKNRTRTTRYVTVNLSASFTF